MFGVATAEATHVLEEDFEDTAGLLVDETRDTLDTATTGETTDGGLSDTCSRCQTMRCKSNVQVGSP